ncbi:MAG TPA: hypothetical protein VG826_28520 [Pirellulales bacterium]|nr:hypothetical protein [Pirellulales bacterium]
MPRGHSATPTTDYLLARVMQRGPSGLLALHDAFHYAKHLGRDARQFAISVEELNRFGLSSADCRWLVAVGILTSPGTARRTRRAVADGSLRIKPGTALILTEEGQRELTRRGLVRSANHLTTATAVKRPRWEADYWELLLDDELVLRLIASATSQAVVLADFERRGWPRRIPNPIQARNKRQSGQQLRDAVHGLNQKQDRIRFRTGGRGAFVEFEVVEGI